MFFRPIAVAAIATLAAAAASPTFAQDAAPSAKPEPLVILFDHGSATVPEKDLAVLDHASRLYRDGKPIVMVISGSTDSTGSPRGNLMLSQKRDQAVLRGLIARGIPAERFQLLAKGESEPAVPGKDGEEMPENRRVEISWR